ncbi:MAG: SAM-dependent methyltransferase [Pseudonocardiaceae bacterium]
MERPSWVPTDVDLEHPSAARVYDYYLGGSHNFAVDREMARRAIALWPDLPQVLQANRAFLRRAVRYLVSQGITQFLDIGSGIPTVGNVHEVAQEALPEARVLYVDVEPVAVAHTRAILEGNDRADIVQAELSDVDVILRDPRAGRLLDLSEPIGVLMVALLHFVPDEANPAKIVASYRERMASGSYLVLSHATHEGRPDQAGSHTALYQSTTTPMTMRSRGRVEELLNEFDMVSPGVVFLPQWRPESPSDVDDRPERFTGYAAVGRRG